MLNIEKLKDKRFFDEKRIPDDVWVVLRASSALSVGEFRVFQIAYKEWFGKEADEDWIERYFVQYMFNDIVPQWVRHFAKRVLILDENGDLDANRFGIERPGPATNSQKWRGVEAFAWVIGSLLVLILIAEMAGRFAELPCRFPPCG